MLDISTLDKFDTQGMYKVYDRWPQIAKESYESNLEPIDFKDIDHIVFSGMGGSGAIGDILSSILSNTDIHVKVVKGYHLPTTVDSNTLVVTTSISGNTIETLSVLESASRKVCKIIAFSSGGKIETFCSKNDIEYRKVPQYNSPRASFTAFVYSVLHVMNSILPINKQDIFESISTLENLSNQVSSKNLTEKNPSLNLAEWISGISLIYYPWGLQPAATRFKNSLQENTKSHAMTENIIEACHNGIVSWEKPSNVRPILIQGQDDYIKTKERWKILKEYFETNGIEFREVLSESGSILTKLIGLIYILDYSTIYLAVKNKIDPSPINSIDFIKSKLS